MTKMKKNLKVVYGFNPLIQVNDFYLYVVKYFKKKGKSFNPLIQVNDFYGCSEKSITHSEPSFNPLIQVNDFYPYGKSDYWDIGEDEF